MARLSILFMLTLSFFLAIPTQAANFTVNNAASLIAAINTANANGAADVITLTASITLTADLPQITADAGNAITIEGAGFTIDGNNSYRIFYTNANLTINNLVITGGIGSNVTGFLEGGGIYIENGTVTLNNSTLSNNDAEGGGAVLNQGGTLTLNNSIVSGNSSGTGGGIFNYLYGILTLNNSIVSGNSLAAYLGNRGGGIFNTHGSTAIINNSMVSGNSSEGLGGGIDNTVVSTLIINNSIVSGNSAQDGGGISNDEDSTLTMSNSVVSGNSATDNGGGIYNAEFSTLILNNSIISGNSATDNGGGIYNFRAYLTMSNSVVSGNSATDNGGGIYNEATDSILSNSTISGNSALLGGGIYNYAANLTLNNSTVSANTGGGIFTFSSISIELWNSILADQTSGFDYEASGINVLSYGGMNIVADSSLTDASILNVDPNLGPLQANGGPTETHALLGGSPAIDTSGAGATNSDQRGAAAVGTRDIGAFESSSTVPSISFSIDQTSIVEANGITSAVVTVTLSDYGGNPVDIYFDFAGTAVTADYGITGSTTLTFTGNGSQNFTITAVNDSLSEASESITLTAYLIGAATISSTNPQDITINEPPQIPPNFSKAFATSPIILGGITSLSFTIDNTASIFDATGLDFTDNLPASMTIATPANASTTCTGGTLTAVDGSGSINYTGGTVTTSSTCTISVDVVGILVGTHSNITGDLTSSAGNSGTATADLIVNPSPSSSTSPAQSTVSQSPQINVFDPAISKLGVLVPGQLGVTGEALEWIVTVSNTGSIVGNNVVISDTLNPALQIDSVDAPNASVTINGQTVTVTYAALQVGETQQFSIFTTVLNGVRVDNTACVTASNQGAEECVTVFPISQLPRTGERPLWAYATLVGLGLLGLSTLFVLLKSKTLKSFV